MLDGVDLRVTADSMGGLSDVLVVHTAQAAANPALATVTLGTTVSDGLTTQVDAGHNISVLDAAGDAVFHAPGPLMWDSGTTSTPNATRSATAADDPAATSPPPDAHVAQVGVQADATSVTLTPDHGLLTGSDTHYPVYIDPSWTGQPTYFAWVQQAYPNQSNWNSTASGEPAVGYEGWEPPYGITRSFFQFHPGWHTDTHVLSAYFKVTGVSPYSGSADCDMPHTMVVNSTAPLFHTMHWNNEPNTWSQQDVKNAYNGYGSCPNRTTSFNVTEFARNDNGQGTLTYRIRAQYEDHKSAYMRFNHKASLTINYNRIPNVPTAFAFSPTPRNPSTNGCGSTNGWIGATSSVTASAHISDPDGSAQNIQGQFQLWDKGGSGTATDLITYSDSAGHSSHVSGSGGTVSVRFPASLLKNGHRYGSDVRTTDGIDHSAGGDLCYFWYDDTAPTNLTVTSTDYPSTGSTSLHVGQSGVFHLSAADVVPSGANYSNISHFAYSTSSAADLAGDGGTHVSATLNGATGTGDLTLTPTTWGVNYLYVAAIDKAGNQSATTTYTYYVPDDPTATVHPGDVDNDGRPDLLAANKISKNLELYPTLSRAPNPVVVAATAANSPDGQTWANTLIAHRGSYSGGYVDDLWAHKEGASQLYLYYNNIYSAGGLSGNGNRYYTTSQRAAIPRPGTCADADCSGYNTTDWSDVTQLLAPGDLDGDGQPDIITVENGTLWLYPAYPGGVDSPHKLGTGFGSFRMIAPGDASGDGVPDLWGVDDAGHFNLYYTTRTAGDPTSVTLTEVDGNGSGFQSQYRPLITSPGDVDGDGNPDVYTTYLVDGSPHPQLWANMGEQKSTGPIDLTGHRVVDDTIDWSAITNLS